MEISVVELHNATQYKTACMQLLNSEWPRSSELRERNLDKSCDNFPLSVVLTVDGSAVGHARLCSIPGKEDGCWIESVVIRKDLRGKGYGKRLMLECENIAHSKGYNFMYLSTHDKEQFYCHIGYVQSAPVCTLGSSSSLLEDSRFEKFREQLAQMNHEYESSCITSSNHRISNTSPSSSDQLTKNATGQTNASIPTPPPAPPEIRRTGAIFMKKALLNESEMPGKY